MYPVEVMYAAEPQTDYVESALSTILQIHFEMPPGDILVFLTGREEIEAVERSLQEKVALFPPTAAQV
jgi:HrpA-like RNA helicase